MTDVIRMAREAGGATGWDSEQTRSDPLLCDTDFVFDLTGLHSFVEAVQADEREKWAKVAEQSVNCLNLAAALRANKVTP